MKKISEVLDTITNYLDTLELSNEIDKANQLLKELNLYSEELDEIYRIKNAFVVSCLYEIKEDYLFLHCDSLS